MTKKNFMQQVVDKVQEISPVPDAQVQWNVFTKNNDTKRFGIIIQLSGDESVCPTIYVDRFYEDFLRKKKTIDEVAEQVWELIDKVRFQKERYRNFSAQWEDCKDRIYYRLVSRKRNKELLEDIPYIPFLDLAIIFGVVCNRTEDGLETLTVTEQLLSVWEQTTAELFRLAEKNTPQLFPARMTPLLTMLFEYLDLPDAEIPEVSEDYPAMQFLSNTSGINGASVLLYPGMIESIAAELDANLYILPSSIHELIILPESTDTEASELSAMVKHINENHVSRDEILSDQSYFYDRKEHRFKF